MSDKIKEVKRIRSGVYKATSEKGREFDIIKVGDRWLVKGGRTYTASCQLKRECIQVLERHLSGVVEFNDFDNTLHRMPRQE